MYPFPKDIDIALFIGASLVQVCVTQNTVSLSFDAELMLVIEGAFRLDERGETEESRAPKVPLTLFNLVGQAVSAVEVTPHNDFRLRFGADRALECVDDSDTYECYRVVIRGRETIV